MPRTPHFELCALQGNVQTKIIKCSRSKFHHRKRSLQKKSKLKFRSVVKQWHGPTLLLAP